MKLLNIVCLLVFVGCGHDDGHSSNSGACTDSNLNGVWQRPGEVLTLQSNCTGTNTLCGETFTYAFPVSNPGNSAVDVLSVSGGGGCPTIGAYTCAVSFGSNILDMNCGTGVLHYTR